MPFKLVLRVKNGYQTPVHIFVKCWPIFSFLSLAFKMWHTAIVVTEAPHVNRLN